MGEILQAFHDGEEVRGWALYWASLHNHLADRLAADAALRAAVKTVRFEDLCRRPRETLAQLFAHCDLPDSDVLVAHPAGPPPMPSSYRPDFHAPHLAPPQQP